VRRITSRRAMPHQAPIAVSFHWLISVCLSAIFMKDTNISNHVFGI
jgi:hypothetical protein